MGKKGILAQKSLKKGKSKKKQHSRRECKNLELTLEKVENEKEEFIDSCASVDSRSKCRNIANLTYNEKIEEIENQLKNCPK